MMNIQIIFSQMLMLFAMMFTGYFIWKKEWLDENSYQKLSKIVVNIFNPLLILYGVMGKDSGGDVKLLAQNLGFVLLYFVILFAAGYATVWLAKPKKEERDIYRMMMLLPNVAFMGIPIITSVFGTKSMIYIVFYMLAYNLILYTYGIILAERAAKAAGTKRLGQAQKGAWKRILNPGVIASIAAIFIFVLKIPIPSGIASFCNYMGNATIPLSMILIGTSIAKADLKQVFANPKIYCFVLIKMLVLPILIIALMKGISADSTIFGVFALELAMPVGTIITLIAKENGADETCCTNGIVLSTLISVVTIPLVSLFLL